MGARQKLNQAHLNGVLMIATVIGVASQSWTVFWIAALIAIGCSLHTGDIRLRRRTR